MLLSALPTVPKPPFSVKRINTSLKLLKRQVLTFLRRARLVLAPPVLAN
jgi:hypothetical protein